MNKCVKQLFAGKSHVVKIYHITPLTPLQKLNEQAAAMFESGEEPEVTTGLGIMNELVVPCIPLLLVHDAERDLLAVEDVRNRWCSYLGQEMECESLRDQEHTWPARYFWRVKVLGYWCIPCTPAKDHHHQGIAHFPC